MKLYEQACLFAIVILSACNTTPENPGSKNDGMNDPHSFAQSDHVSVSHLDWVANIDFKKQVIEAEATWTLLKNKPSERYGV